ncbi:Piso0_000500 [Millerozyma farinosa CBS 7064]|uniref:Piso0_000500 protein n=1 Tax=Pichia sorbitophila (strain ATCC MYA-4447 / BCRC 22081 / CBS 7064 / NBRC 10061 / NRRL Y-12695) TaxID=559304 RepID=G8YVL5_PICSO|nr:Piso0_000500 [Millerozyma farinosa CBS 7064]CCE73459.1 Piso0_000500 [Millerozyma farinosa CBS 7064]
MTVLPAVTSQTHFQSQGVLVSLESGIPLTTMSIVVKASPLTHDKEHSYSGSLSLVKIPKGGATIEQTDIKVQNCLVREFIYLFITQNLLF